MEIKKLFSDVPTALDRTNVEQQTFCKNDEMDRIHRICAASSRTLTDFRVGRLEKAAVNTSIASTRSENNIEAVLPLLAENDRMLRDPTLPLSEEIHSLFPADEPEVDKRNFLVQVNQLVAEIMQLLSKLSDRDRKKTDHMKKEFDGLNRLAGDAIRSRGEWGLNGALFGLGTAVLCAFIAPGISQAASGVAQSLGNLFATQQEAKTAVLSNKISLINTELQNIATKGGDNSGWKNELLQSLNDVKEWMRASVRTNG